MNISVKIYKCWAVAKLVRKPRRKVCQRSIQRVSRLKEIFQRWMRADEVEFRRNSGSLVQQVIFPPHKWSTRLSAVKVWDIIENRAREAIVLGFSKPRTTFECIYTNPFTSKVSRGLDKPSPKLLGQDKQRLELAVGLLSRERSFCTICTGCLVFASNASRGQSKPRHIFSRINDPNVSVKFYVNRL